MCKASEYCYDCGSTIANAHTALCDFREPSDTLLPAYKSTQWWIESASAKAELAKEAK